MPELQAVYESADRRVARDRALTLQSAGIPYDIRLIDHAFTILVRSEDADAAAAEIAAFERENRPTAASTIPEPTPQASGWHGVVVYSVVVIAGFVLQQRGGWVEAGATMADRVCAGEWWRTVTALTLHSDLGHLLANLMFGGLFGLLVGQLLGSGVGWCAIVIGGALGNGLNAWIQPAQHSAIGASTAVFAALGILAALPWPHRWRSERRSFRRLASIIAGGILLAMTGIGGPRTDTLAHVTGFLVGVAFGALGGILGARVVLGRWTQATCGLAALALVGAAWMRAWQAG